MAPAMMKKKKISKDAAGQKSKVKVKVAKKMKVSAQRDEVEKSLKIMEKIVHEEMEQLQSAALKGGGGRNGLMAVSLLRKEEVKMRGLRLRQLKMTLQ